MLNIVTTFKRKHNSNVGIKQFCGNIIFIDPQSTASKVTNICSACHFNITGSFARYHRFHERGGSKTSLTKQMPRYKMLPLKKHKGRVHLP